MKIASKLLFLAVCGAACSVQAGPVGPSARMAARLKKHPTSNWLAHYLPDDRYKIAGGIWKYVSTDLDTYYHRPDSPNMLRQPANIVIGFASAAEAEEAGYRPDASVFTEGPLGMARSIGGRRVVLSDRVSTLVLPSGWQKGPANFQNVQGGSVAMDIFISPKSQPIVVGVYSAPPTLNVDFGQFTTPEGMKGLRNNLSGSLKQLDSLGQSTGNVNSNQFAFGNVGGQLDKMMGQMKVSGITLNGMRGVKTVITGGMGGQASTNYVFGRGRKMWFISDYSKRPIESSALVKSVLFR
jgi:hypothetical protein